LANKTGADYGANGRKKARRLSTAGDPTSPGLYRAA
jgi:hypothetical protein